VATPVLAVAERVKRALAETSGLVTDVGSVKGGITAAVDDARFVGGHPMAGSELDGFDGADASLFEGAVWVLTPTATTADSTFSQVAAVVAELGADVVALPADRHDQVVAVISHVPHLAAATLMGLASDRAEEHAALLRLAAGGFRDMTRIASGHPSIWLDICAENRPAILSALDGLIGGLSSMRDVVDRDDRAALFDRLQHAREARTNLPNRVNQPSELAEVRIPSRTARVPPQRCSRSPQNWASTSPASRSSTASRATAGWRGPGRCLDGRSVSRRSAGARLPSRRATAGLVSRASRRADSGPTRRSRGRPGSKSIANRALICAALADGSSTLTNLPDGDDTEAMLSCLQCSGSTSPVDRRWGADHDSRREGAVETGSAGAADPAGRDDLRFVTLSPRSVRVHTGRWRGTVARPPMGPCTRPSTELGASVRAGEQRDIFR
jgi:prephenate dehydrogenase